MAQGCLSILSELPIQHVNVKDLDALVRDPSECTFFRFYVLLLLGGGDPTVLTLQFRYQFAQGTRCDKRLRCDSKNKGLA